MEEIFLFQVGVDLVVCATACGLGILVTRRVRRTRLWFPTMVLFAAAAIFAASDGANAYALAFGDPLIAAGFSRSSYIGVGLSIPAAVHLVAVHPRNLRSLPVRYGVSSLYVVGTVFAVLAPTSLLLEHAPGDFVGVPTGYGPAYWPLQIALVVGLATGVGWCAYLAVRGRTAFERKTGAGFFLMLVVPFSIGAGAAASGLHEVGPFDTTSMAYAGWVVIAAFVVMTGRLTASVPSTFSGLLNSVAVAILVVGPDGAITSANEQMEDLLGKTKGSLAQRPIADVLASALSRGQDANLVSMSVMGVLRGRLDAYEAKMDGVGPNGRTCQLRVLPLGNRTASGEATAALVIFRDETDRLALERSTARSRDLLDLVVRMLGHDLKAPLSVIQGYLDLDRTAIQEAKGPLDVASMAIHMEKMAEAIVNMHVLMGNARALSRLPGAEEHDPQRGQLDLTRTLHQTIDLLKPIANARHVTVKAAVAPGVMAYVVPGFDSVPRNLIDNAIKYTPPGGEVTVTLGSLEGRAVLSVGDTGPGIPPGKEDQLFRKFERLGAEKGSTEGHGLGLSIVAKLVELSKGTIRLQERADGRSGAVFVVELATAPPAKGPGDTAPTSSSQAGS